MKRAFLALAVPLCLGFAQAADGDEAIYDLRINIGEERVGSSFAAPLIELIRDIASKSMGVAVIEFHDSTGPISFAIRDPEHPSNPGLRIASPRIWVQPFGVNLDGEELSKEIFAIRMKNLGAVVAETGGEFPGELRISPTATLAMLADCLRILNEAGCRSLYLSPVEQAE